MPRCIRLWGTIWLLMILNSSIYANIIVSQSDIRPSQAQQPSHLTLYETRATWLNAYAFNEETRRNQTIDNIIHANLNTVFLIGPPIESNRGWSDPTSFNQTLILLKAQNIAVHAWICCLYRISGQTADFVNETEQTAQKNWALALLDTYPLLDGIHLDYIRYNYGSNVNATKLAGVHQTIQMINSAIIAKYQHKFLTAAIWSLSGEIETPDDQIPLWYHNWFAANLDNPINRWNKVGYNFQGYPTFFAVQQDPVSWNGDSIIDVCISMEYDPSNSWWMGEVDIWNSFFNGDPASLMLGLGWYADLWEGGEITEHEVAHKLIDKIRYGQTNKSHGFSFFEFGAQNNNDSFLIPLLVENETCPFYYPAKSHLLSSEEIPKSLDGSDESDQSYPDISPWRLATIISVFGGFLIMISIYAYKRKRHWKF